MQKKLNTIDLSKVIIEGVSVSTERIEQLKRERPDRFTKDGLWLNTKSYLDWCDTGEVFGAEKAKIIFDTLEERCTREDVIGEWLEEIDAPATTITAIASSAPNAALQNILHTKARTEYDAIEEQLLGKSIQEADAAIDLRKRRIAPRPPSIVKPDTKTIQHVSANFTLNAALPEGNAKIVPVADITLKVINK